MRLLPIIFMGAMFAPAAAQAASVRSAKYDAKTEIITVEVTYAGGCKEHKFKLRMNACMETYPVQCSADLVDLTKGDFCEALVSKTVTFKAGDYGLLDSYYDNGSLEIIGSDRTSASIQLKRIGGGSMEPQLVTYSCPTASGKTVRFLPSYGEVHYLNADGSEWKQHDDGLNFDELILESHPPQISVTIIDDEGENVGGWHHVDGAATFTAKYRGKTYSKCRQD